MQALPEWGIYTTNEIIRFPILDLHRYNLDAYMRPN